MDKNSGLLKVGNDNLVHFHHVGESVGFFHQLANVFWHDLPAESKFVFAPAALL